MDNRLLLPANHVLDCYRIIRVVGAGGFGITYEAEDMGLGASVALKEYYPAEFGDRDARMSIRPKSEHHRATFDWGRTSFLQEARMLARFSHPAIVRVTRVFEANSTAYMVMSFERGQSLEDRLKGLGRPPSQEELDRIAEPLLDALESMHAVDFLHRDIAPDNIIVRPDGSPLLLDFGAARRSVGEMSRALTGIVKAGYSPQEQYATDSRMQGPWTDIYAFGGTLYRAVTGRPPDEATLRGLEDRMLPAARAAVGSYRPGFLAAIDACLRVKIADRPQSVAALRPMLLALDAPVGRQAMRLAEGSRTTGAAVVRSPGRRWGAAAAAALVLAGGIYGGAEYVRRQGEASRVEDAGTTATARKPAEEGPRIDAAAKERQERIAAEKREVEERARREEEAKRQAENEAAKRKTDEAALQREFVDNLSDGNWAAAEPLARDVLKAQPGHRTAHAFMGVNEFKARRYGPAEEHFKSASAAPIGELTSTLALAWLYRAQGRTQEALAALDSPKQPDWAQYYLRYHRALLADQAGRASEARSAYERIPKNDQRTLRITLAYARHAASVGDTKLALSLIRAHLESIKGEGNPVAHALQRQLEAGERPLLLITTPNEGMAEAFYGVGEALANEGGSNAALVYLQLALYVDPASVFALAALANAYETAERYEAAIAAYDRIPKGTPLEFSIDIRKALNLDRLGRIDEAQSRLERLARDNPKDLRPLDALGSIMRGHKRFADAADYYTRAIALIDRPEQKHWSYFYSRGTAYERLKRWPLAEADLQRALQLNPDEPVVLNYLGYSWIDQNRNLKQALALIEKAVRLKPDDGYIVDSLGWAYYRLGRFADAVKQLERAVELRDDDPVLTDHLGDALWKVGRKSEARARWEKALTLKPEAEDAEKIRQKLALGLAEN